MKRNGVTNLSPAMQTNTSVSSDTHGCGYGPDHNSISTKAPPAIQTHSV
jgi:hypothetical protein